MSHEKTQQPLDLSRYLFTEEKLLRGDFREYFLRKRFNFIATLNNNRDLGDLFLHVDEDWVSAIKLLGQHPPAEWLVPVQLTVYCFRELRLSAEMLLSGCTTPGFSHLRSALESFVHAQKIMREPMLGSVWLARDSERPEYDKHFKANFKANLFPPSSGFAHLHGVWQMLCDTGPHPNVNSLGISSSITESHVDVNWAVEFFEVSEAELASNFILMVMCSLEMFKHTYNVFHERLSSDPNILRRLHSHLARYAQLKANYRHG